MASRLLHRLRHVLAGDGPGGETAAGPEAEQFPESSELEDDDAEGLSSRLSGTLSFTSAEDDDDNDDDEDEEAIADPLAPRDEASGEDAGECAGTEAGPAIGLHGTRVCSAQANPGPPLGCVTFGVTATLGAKFSHRRMGIKHEVPGRSRIVTGSWGSAWGHLAQTGLADPQFASQSVRV